MCRNIVACKQAKHRSTDLWFTFSLSGMKKVQWSKCVSKWLQGGCCQRFIFKCSRSSLFILVVTMEKKYSCISAQFGLTFDTTTFGLFAEYKLLMRLKNTSKVHSVFVFGIARQQELKKFILKGQKGIFLQFFLVSQWWWPTWLQTQRGLPWCKAAYGLF